MRAGLLASLLSFLLNVLLTTLAGGASGDMMNRAGLTGSILLVPIGVVVGWLRDLGEQVRWELAERKRAEEALHRAHDELEMRVRERTAELAKANEALQTEVTECKRVEEEAQRRTAQAALLYEVGQRVSGELELEPLLSEIVTAICDAFDYYGVLLMLLDEASERLTLQSVAGGYTDLFPEDLWIAVGEGMTGYAAATGETQISGDVSKDPHYIRKAEEETKSELAVPIKSGQSVIGMLDLQSDKLDAFDETDVLLMETLADQVAVAIKNARLFEEARSHAEELEVINEVGRTITSVLDRDTVLQQIVDTVKTHFGHYFVSLALVEGNQLVFRSGSTIGDSGIRSEFALTTIDLTHGPSLAAEAARTDQPVLVHDAPSNPRYLPMEELPDTRCELCLPIRVKGRVIGVLDVQSDRHHAFDQTDVALHQSLASQAGVAIENARLFEDTRSQLAQLTALRKTTKAVASTLELDKLLNLITQQATTLLQGDGGIINLVDWEKKEDEVVAASGSQTHTLGSGDPLEGCLSGWVTLHNQPVISNQLQSDSRAAPVYRSGEEQGQSAAIAPLTIKDQVVGTLVVMDKQGGKGEFDQADLDLLMAFANQAATAIQNARLYEEIQQELADRKRADEALEKRVTQLALISDVGGKIAAVLELDSVLDRTARLVQESFGYHHVALFTVDREQGELVMRARAGDFVYLFPPDHRLKLGQGMVGWVGRHGEALQANDVDAEPRYVNLYPDIVPTRSELSVPIRVGRVVVGVLDVQSPQLNAFDENDVMVIETLADQIAAAIENARLYEAVQRELTERKRAERQLRRYAAELEQANEEIKQFAYIVSHDLRAPLVNLKGFAAELHCALETVGPAMNTALPHLDEKQQRVVTTALQEDVPEALGFIDSSVTRMDAFIKAVLELSRLGRRELGLEPIDMNVLVQATLQTLAHQIEQRQVKVTVGALPEVIADRTSMEQIMGNILGNAVKYLDSDRPGEIEVIAESGDDETTFLVRDNGCGIAERDMDKVFAPFRRAGRQDVPGEGMGLAYVQTLVRRHGGRIWCESEPGVGTTFTFTIPHHLAKGVSHV